MNVKKITIYILLSIVATSFLFSASKNETLARKSYSKAVDGYLKLKKYGNKNRSIDRLLDSAIAYIRNSRTALSRKQFLKASRMAGRANEILASIRKRVKDGGFALTKRRVMDRLLYARHTFTMMKKYNLRAEKIMHLFTDAKGKMKFARMLIREDKLSKANKFINQAIKILMKIPDVYKRELEKETIAQKKIFQAQVMAEFTLLFYVKENETKGEFRRVRYHLDRARQRYKVMDYAGVNRETAKTHKKIKQVQELKKKIDKENKKRLKKCMDANLAIQYANSLRRTNSQYLKRRAIYDTFYLARRQLRKAEILLRQGYCKDAYKTASKSLNLFSKIAKMRRNIVSERNAAESLLQRARLLYEKAAKSRLPFDAEAQLKKAKSEINNANDLIKLADYAMATSKLKATIMRLKSLVR